MRRPPLACARPSCARCRRPRRVLIALASNVSHRHGEPFVSPAAFPAGTDELVSGSASRLTPSQSRRQLVTRSTLEFSDLGGVRVCQQQIVIDETSLYARSRLERGSLQQAPGLLGCRFSRALQGPRLPLIPAVNGVRLVRGVGDETHAVREGVPVKNSRAGVEGVGQHPASSLCWTAGLVRDSAGRRSPASTRAADKENLPIRRHASRARDTRLRSE